METIMEITVVQTLDEENIKAYKAMSEEEVKQMFEVWKQETLKMLQDEIDGDFKMEFKAHVKE